MTILEIMFFILKIVGALILIGIGIRVMLEIVLVILKVIASPKDLFKKDGEKEEGE